MTIIIIIIIIECEKCQTAVNTVHIKQLTRTDTQQPTICNMCH